MPTPGKRQALRLGSGEVSPASPVSMTPAYDTKASTSFCPDGHVKLPGPGRPAEMEPVVCRLRTGKEPVLLIGAVTVSLFAALGCLPPPLMQA